MTDHQAPGATVTMRHLREAGFCAAGARDFALRHGLDWRGFVRHGIAAEDLERTGDAMAARAVERARNEVIRHG